MIQKFVALLAAFILVFAFSANCFAAGSPTATVIPTETTISSYNLIITDIKPSNNVIKPGDQVTFDVTIKNIGTEDVPAGTIIEYQIQFGDGTSTILWNDQYDGGLKAGESITLSTSSGSSGVNYWVPEKGTYTITATVDPNNKFPKESSKTDNQYAIQLKVPTKTGAEPTTSEKSTTKESGTTKAGQNATTTPHRGSVGIYYNHSSTSPKTGSDVTGLLLALFVTMGISLIAHKKFSKQ